MAERKGKPVKAEAAEEYDEDDVPLSVVSKAKAAKKEDPGNDEDDEDEDVEDNLPLSLSKSKFKKSKSPSSKVKKEEEDGYQDQNVKKREEGKSSGKTSKTKKREADDSEDEDFKDKKKQMKKKKKRIGEEKVIGKNGKASVAAVAAGKVKREKKVYDLPGQKHDPPEERDPLRIFYETLYDQVPESEMAAFWMMEWGLLPLNEAKKVYEKKLKKAQQQKLSSPVKVASVKKTSTATVKKVPKTISKTVTKIPKKQKASDSEADDDDDFIMPKKINRQKVSS
ncbi:unnamed protein product [Musa acuminata var. zebrina]